MKKIQLFSLMTLLAYAGEAICVGTPGNNTRVEHQSSQNHGWYTTPLTIAKWTTGITALSSAAVAAQSLRDAIKSRDAMDTLQMRRQENFLNFIQSANRTAGYIPSTETKKMLSVQNARTLARQIVDATTDTSIQDRYHDLEMQDKQMSDEVVAHTINDLTKSRRFGASAAITLLSSGSFGICCLTGSAIKWLSQR